MKNPIAEGFYADPESRVYGDTVYIYVTHSLPFEEQKNLSLFYSKDLRDFIKVENILDMKTFPSATSAVWAPSVVEWKGRYYIVFAANNIYHDDEPGGLYIGVSDTPIGPFRNIFEDGRPFLNRILWGAQPIDAHFYREGETLYLYWGGWGHLLVAKMDADMRGFSEEREITPTSYVEAPYVMREGEKYLLMYSSGNWMDGTYRVLCAISNSPFGPFSDASSVLENAEIACGAGHNSAFFFGGKHYIAYHRRFYEDKNPHHRVLCIDEMRIENGRIQPIEMT